MMALARDSACSTGHAICSAELLPGLTASAYRSHYHLVPA
jgi:hypothetical protein